MSVRLEARNLTLRYGDTTAIEDLTFTLEEGKIHGLLGRNGSGKTSLLSVIAAFRPATSGSVLLDGEPVWESPEATHRICFIRGHGDTVKDDWPADKVSNALSLAATLRPNWDEKLAENLIEKFRIPMKKRLSHLSRGQRSAVGVVLGLASRAPLTIFDETYLGMDAPARYTFYEALLADYIEHPRTFIISTHLIEEVSSILEEVLILDQGHILLQERVEDLRSRGTAVTGPQEAVDHFCAGLRVLSSRQLGSTKQSVIYEELGPERIREAGAAGLELGPLPLQDIFVHLTDPERTPV